AVDLQDTREALEMADRTFRRAVGCINIGNTGRIGSAPWPVVGGIGPELAGFGAPATGIQYRRRRLVGKQSRPLLQSCEQAFVQWTQLPGGMTNPICQRRAVEIDALPRVDLCL